MASYAEMALVRSMSVLATSQDAVAHNLANVDTGAFKRRESVAELAPGRFHELLSARLPTVRYREYTVWEQGTARESGNRLDVAIEGPGFFRVRDEAGREFLTRNGDIRLDEQGRVTNRAGMRYLDVAGQELQVQGADGPPSDVAIAPNGTLTDPNADGQTFGQLALVQPTDLGRMVPVGAGLYVDTARQPAPPAKHTEIRQGYVEGSNVDSLQEMVRMITIQRTFGATERALSGIGRMHENLATNMLR